MVCTECNDAPSNGNYGLSRTYNLRYKDYSRNIILTDYGLVDDLCRDFCQQARSNVETVAQFIDDNFNKPLDRYEAIINVNVKDKYGNYPPAGWGRTTRRALFGQREINGINRSYGTDITVVAHEFCHGLIQSISNDRPIDDEFSEKNALEESFCDIFAVLVRNYHRDDGCYRNNPHNWLWDVGENFQEGTVSQRQLDKLLSLTSNGAESFYEQIQIDNWTTGNNNYHEHELSLIHSHAFYRLMTIHNTVINGQPLFNGEFALKLFGAVLEYISTLDSFSESRRVFKAQAEVSLKASPRQLDAISQAFIDVRIE
jgi:Zn-dependent metalloprotease